MGGWVGGWVEGENVVRMFLLLLALLRVLLVVFAYPHHNRHPPNVPSHGAFGEEGRGSTAHFSLSGCLCGVVVVWG